MTVKVVEHHNFLNENFIRLFTCYYVLPLCLFACRHVLYIRNVVKVSLMKRSSKIPENAECAALIRYNKTTKPSEGVRRAVISLSSMLK